MASPIVELWVRKIEEGERTYDEVPKKLKESVKKRLEEDGYIIGEDGAVAPAADGTGESN